MRLTRAYVGLPLAVGQHFVLPGSAAAHLVRVLRLREGDACVLFNGDGRDYGARLLSASRHGAEAEILAARAIGNESPLRIVLLQGITRGEKMDLILQKATELGVAAFVPVFAERTQVRLDGERIDKRLAHWRSVVVSACEQSGRAFLPDVFAPAALVDAAFAQQAGAWKLTLDPGGELALATLAVPSPQTLVVAIGPEGGWSPRDRETLRGAGYQGLRLGPRILRTETAGLAAIAALQSRFGDL